MEPEDWTDRMLTALQHGVKGTFFAEQGLVLSLRHPCLRTSILMQGDPLTGEPDAGIRLSGSEEGELRFSLPLSFIHPTRKLVGASESAHQQQQPDLVHPRSLESNQQLTSPKNKFVR